MRVRSLRYPVPDTAENLGCLQIAHSHVIASRLRYEIALEGALSARPPLLSCLACSRTCTRWMLHVPATLTPLLWNVISAH